MKRKRIPILIGLMCLALILAMMPLVGACAEKEAPAPAPTPTPTPTPKPEPVKPIEAMISHTYAPGTIWARQLEIMEEYIEEGTDGRIDIKIFPSKTLHSTYEESVQACAAGTVPISFGNITTPQRYDKRWTCYQAPGIVRGWDHWKRVQDTASFKKLNEDLAEQAGIKLWFFSCIIPFGDIPWNTERDLVTPDDWKGLKMRTAPSELQIKTVEAFGATAVPLPTAETLAAISTGVVDGGIITPSTATSAWSAQETLPYCTMPYGGFALSFMSVSFFYNVEWYESLPTDVREAFDKTTLDLREATEKDAYDLSIEHWEKYKAAPGRHITYLTEEQTKVWSDIIDQEVLPGVAGEFGCTELFEDAKAVLEK